MTNIASKLAGSVRQAKQQQQTLSQPAEENEIKKTAQSSSPRHAKQEAPLPMLASRRVWPD